MDTAENIAAAVWSHTPRTLVSGTPGAPATQAEEIAAAVWAHTPRTLSGSTYTLTAASGGVTITGVTAALLWLRQLVANAGTLALAGVAAAWQWLRRLTGANESVVITGESASLQYSGDALSVTERRKRFMLLGITQGASAPSVSSLAVDVYVDMEAGSHGNALTGTLLADGAHHGSVGTWSMSGTATRMTVSTAAETALPVPITADGTTYTDSGTRGWAFNHATGGSEYATLALSPTRADVVVGCYLTIGVPVAWTANFDFVQIRRSVGTGAWVNLKTTGAGNVIRTESFVGGVVQWGADISVTPNTRYWVTFHYHVATSGSTFTMKVYDGSTLALIGTSSGAMDDGAHAATHLDFGIANGSAYAVTGTSYWDDIIMSWDAGDFPLLPAL